MKNTIRTTIRIRKDLLDQSKMIAVQEATSLQEIINQTLARGLTHISDLKSRKKAMAKIDNFRQLVAGKKINLQALLTENKAVQK